MIDTAVTLTVLPDDDYYYDVHIAPGELAVFVRNSKGDTTQQLNFGSIDEMRAVAKAMMNACSIKEQVK